MVAAREYITRLLLSCVLGLLASGISVALADGTYQFVDASITRSETDANQIVNIRIQRTGGTGPEDVTIRGSGVLAGAGNGNYFGSTGGTDTVVNIPGNGTFNVPFTIVGDNDTQVDVTVNFAFQAFSAGGIVGGLGAASLNIEDDDVASYSFSATDFNVVEGDAGTTVVTITVNRINATGDEQVQMQVGGGTATPGAAPNDYTGNGVVIRTFTGGQTSRDFDITINGDTILEPDETIDITFLSFEVLGVTGAIPAATLTIENDDQSIGFSQANYGTPEGDVASSTNVVELVRTGDLDLVQNVEVSVVGGVAIAGTDFAAGPYNTAFAVGASTATINVGILGDIDVEGDEDIQLEITQVDAGTDFIDLANNQATLVIEDDDAATYRFSSATFDTPEGNAGTTSIPITVERTGGLGVEDVTVQVTGTSATPGSDYVNPAGGVVTLNFGALDTSQVFNIDINGDMDLEQDEVIVLTIVGTSGTGTVGLPITATLNILNDEAEYRFVNANVSTNEGDLSNFTNALVIERLGDTSVAENVTVTDLLTGTATSATDYAAGPWVAAFGAGDTTATVPISIIGDLETEPDETINVQITLTSGTGAIGTPDLATLTLLNDDIATYEFSEASYTALEGDANNIVNVVQITRTGAVDTAEDVTVNLTNGTAIGGVGNDFTVGPIVVPFAAGDTVQLVPIELLGDTEFEGDETINIALALFNNGGQAGTQSSTELVIENDDQRYTFTSSAFTVTEDGGAITTVTIEREGPPITETVTVNDTGGGSAMAADFAGTLDANFTAAGPDTVAIDLSIIDDTDAEPDETIEIEIDGAFNTGTPNSATITIADNDAEYEFAAATFSQPEGNVTADATVVIIERNGATNTAATVTVALADGLTPPSANFGTDYTAGPVDVDFAAGDATAVVPLEILGDTTSEDDETIDLTITGVPTGSMIGTQDTATLTLTNDDGLPNFSFTSATYSVTETNANNIETNVVTLTRTDTTSAAQVVVNYAPPTDPPTASSSTAEQRIDFFVQNALLPNNVTCTAAPPLTPASPLTTVFPCTVDFAAGAATAVLPISIIGDTDIEISERIVLTFVTADITSTPTGVATVPNVATLTIVDNDGPSGADLRVLNGTSATSPTIPNGTSNAVVFPLTSLNVPVEREFTLRNTGDSVLNIFSINLPANFSLVSGFPNTLAGNTSETFTIRFDAGVGGTSGGLVEIASSDFADNPYVFPIQGSIEATEIDVTIDGQPLVDGTGSIDFGSTIIGTPVTRTITISNGTGVSLLLSNLNLPDGYSLVGNFPTNVAGGGSETATFQLDAAAVGVFTGTLSFDTNDEDESTYDIALTGTVTDTPQPEIQVAGPQGSIESGGSYDFGSGAVGESPSATFTVSNGGTADLTLDRASLTSSLAGSAFSVTDNFAETTLAVGQSTTFEITLDGSSAGNFSTTLSFANNDADENPFGIDLSGEVSAPEIEVRAGDRVLQDGSSVPVDFGATTLNNVEPQIFTINNLGGVPLTLGGLDLPAGFALDGDFPTTVDANGSANFTINLVATGLGNFAGEVSFDTNDEDENPFSFRVEGVVDDAQLVVLDGLLTVANGSTVDFGSTTLDNAITKTFTIRNEGGANLQVNNLSALPAGFELLSPSSFTFDLAPNQQAEFVVALTADVVDDDLSGALQFLTNDTSASPFSITIEGRVTAEPAPEITVSGSDGAISSGSGFTFDDLPVGEDATETFTVRNAGTAALTLGSVTVSGDGFTLSGDLGTTSLADGEETTFSVRFEGDDEGDATGSVSIDNNDDNENPYVFDLDGTVFVPQPEIEVLRDGSVISDGGSVDLGTVTTGESVTETFTVRNDGEAELTLDNLAVSGTGFEISSGLGDTSLDPDGTTTFTIRFNAGDTAGDASGDISLGSNDDDENPFDISLSADVDVPQPEIEVLAGNSLVSDGGTLEINPIATGEAVTLSLTVRNAGTATLNLEPLEITGTGFSLVNPFGSTTLEPGVDTTFDIRFDAVNRPVGDYSGSISFANNDSDENPYNFTLAASVFVPAPEIEVLGPSGENVADGLGVVDASSIDLGGVGVGQTRTATFTVRNTGDAALTLNSASLASSLSGTVFSVQSTFGQTSLAPGASTIFTLAVDTSATGTFRNIVSFNTNDDDENPFNFAISTTVSAGPEVEVRDGTIIIPDGSATAVSFGTTQVGTAIQKDLAVFNLGSAALNISGFSVTGDAFTIVSTPSGTLAAGQSGVLTVQLDGDAVGTPTAQVSFNTNDPDENPYTFTVRGIVNDGNNNGGGDGEVTVRPGTNQPPVTIVAQPGDNNVAVLQALFSLQDDVPARVTQVEASVFASLDGSRTKVTTTEDFAGFASAKLYIDSNNNGQVDLSDALLGSTTRFDAASGNLVFNLPAPLALSSTQATNVIIAYDFLSTLGDNSLPLVALAGLLPLALLWFGRFRRTSLTALLIVLMVACGGDGEGPDDGNNGGSGPDPDTVYQAVLIDASAEANGNTIDVSFPNGEIGGSNVTVRE
ncbi:MAG: choice-of-anchor D domain-containing protein [Deinococcota bacterium]